MTNIPLTSAYICVGCDGITDSAMQCACGSKALASLVAGGVIYLLARWAQK